MIHMINTTSTAAPWRCPICDATIPAGVSHACSSPAHRPEHESLRAAAQAVCDVWTKSCSSRDTGPLYEPMRKLRAALASAEGKEGGTDVA